MRIEGHLGVPNDKAGLKSGEMLIKRAICQIHER